MTDYKDSREFILAYVNQVVEKAHNIHDRTQKPVKILDLCTGRGYAAGLTLTKLVEDKVPFQATFTGLLYNLLKDAWMQIKDVVPKGSVNISIRDITRLNEYWTIGDLHKDAVDSLKNAIKDPDFPTPPYKHTFEEGSFDLITGIIPFTSLIMSNYEEAVQAIVPFLDSKGSVVFTTGFSESFYKDNFFGKFRRNRDLKKSRKERMPFGEGISHKELDKYFSKAGLERILEPITYTLKDEEHGPSSFYELLVYEASTQTK